MKCTTRSVAGQPPLARERLPGLWGGIYGSFKIAGKLYVQPELLYSQQYHRIEKSGEVDGGYWRSVLSGKVDYLSIPVFLQYEAIEGLKIAAGPLWIFRSNMHHRFRGKVHQSVRVV
ncbi:hypothetical protein ACFQRK_19410 [Parapedobacter sp. GCM10030251]|uniref:hypothetical protein n=1 Tax=Parapedobacter sp. GCM10030251 TaxID=3273419 RepID=UPI0036211AE1